MPGLERYVATAPTHSGAAAERDDSVIKTLHYAGAVVFTCWADLPGGPSGPAGMAWDMARSRTLRRGSEFLQRVEAWALGQFALWCATAERPLAPQADGKLAPAGPWDLRRETLATTGLARLRPAGDGGGNAGPARLERASGPLDALPGAVQRLLLETSRDPVVTAIRWDRDGRAWEDVRSIAIGQRHVVAVLALRDETPAGPGAWELRVWRAERAATGIGAVDHRLGGELPR